MGHVNSISQDPEPLYALLPTENDRIPIVFVSKRVPDETEIKISTQTDKLLKSLFVWQQEFEQYQEDKTL